MDNKIKNPLLPGFYPDPSIIRVDDDFYMVTSSFSYYPGVPIFHSCDLANWEQIGHVLDRPSQLILDGGYISGGIYAPTLRYHNGIYYMITTNVSHRGNFIVTAENPAGPWSEPHWIEDAPGIDPSLFWDDDDKAYYTGNGEGENDPHIWMSEIDLEAFRLVGEKKRIWNGSMVDAWSPEAPHLYKKDGWYYLMIAEGGTEYYHAVTIARSREITGKYHGYEGNPILTHRHLGMQADIVNVGHGDLVELKDGSWYMVMLASRPYGGGHKNMGRETFIAPVIWENGWPVVCPGKGMLEWEYPAALPQCAQKFIPEKDDFDSSELACCWNFLGTPSHNTAYISNSCLHIRAASHPLEYAAGKYPAGSFGFVGRRQQHKSYTVQVKMVFAAEEGQSAGIILLQNDFQSLRMELVCEGGKRKIRVVKGYRNLVPVLTFTLHDKPYVKEICGEYVYENKECTMEITADEQDISFYIAAQEGKIPIAEHLDGGFLGSETAGGFVGTYIGMFASGNGRDSDNYAAFDYFIYAPHSEHNQNGRRTWSCRY